MRGFTFASASIVALAIGMSASSALAQTKSAPAPAAPSAQPTSSAAASGSAVAEVVVTASKRSENLQHASLAVDALSGTAIESRGIKNAVDLQQMLPTVKFVAADQMTVSIRGLGTTNDNIGVDSAVAYNQDGIYLAHPEALAPVLFDLQRVEVVQGPQGTLYGRNSNAGVINFISNDPNFTNGGFVSAGYGNYNAGAAEGAANIALNNVFALRLSGGSEFHDAYAADGGNDQHAYAGRIKLRYKPDDRLDVLLTVDGAHRDGTGSTYNGLCPPNNAAPACTGVNYVPWGGVVPFAYGQRNQSDIFGVSGKVDYNLNWATLTSLTGYKAYWFFARTSAPWANPTTNLFDFTHDDNDKFFTQEIRLASNSDSYVKWVAGLYYSNETQLGGQSFYYHQGTLVQLGGGPNGLYQSFPVTGSLNQSEAVFGDVAVPVTSTVRIRGGLRYTHESKVQSGLVETGIENFGLLSALPTRSMEEQSRVTWKAGLDWDVTPANLLYVTGSNGFKSGGVNNLPTATGSLLTYAPETVTAVELGSKNRFLGGRLQVNADVFWYDYNNYQTYVFWAIPASGAGAPPSLAGATLFPTVNSQKATFEGGEINAIWRATAEDTLTFGVTYMHNRFDKFVVKLPYVAPLDFSGSEVFLSPATTFSLGYSHRFTLPNDDSLTLDGNSQIVSSQIANGNYMSATSANQLYRDPPYHKTGVSLTYRTHQGDWQVIAWARNLENAAVLNAVAGGFPVLSNFGKVDVQIDQPRTYGVTIRKQF